MALTLYDAFVPGFLQTVGAVEGFLTKGAAHFKEKGVDPNSILDAKLAEDMLPFTFQVRSVTNHSIGAIRGVKAGQITPGGPAPTMDYAGLQKMVAETREALQQVKPDELNACEGKDVVLTVRDMKMPFTAEGFLQSFSMPNFYFHATTAYDILRHKGVPVGKRDFLGKMRLKT
jgi:hypothetical protein